MLASIDIKILNSNSYQLNIYKLFNNSTKTLIHHKHLKNIVLMSDSYFDVHYIIVRLYNYKLLIPILCTRL